MVLEIAIAAGVIALLFAGYLAWWVLRQDPGNKKMQEIALAIQQGAQAYLLRQYKTLVLFVVILLALVGFFVSWNAAVAFLAGVIASALAGFIGMTVSVRANVRAAQAAGQGLDKALNVAVKGGSVTGMALVGLGLIGVTGIYLLYKDLAVLIGFGFGASLISLFARVCGGIYLKRGAVGGFGVGKSKKGFQEAAPPNPAVIADNVGDNVGDCAGMAADLFESYTVTIIASMLLGVAFGPEYVTLPLLIGAAGAIASALGIWFVSLGKKKNIMHALYKGVLATSFFAIIGFWFFTQNNMPLFYATLVGVAATMLIGLITEYYTSKEYRPVKEIANAAKTGAGTNLIQGLAVGLESTALPALVIVAAIAVSFSLGGGNPAMGIYMVALAATAMLSLTGIIITLDAYGPITDNAGGIAEMSGMPPGVRKNTDALDSVGNTTKATTKGFAIAGAALGALALFAAFAESTGMTSINLLNPAVVVGLFIGALLPFLFSSFLMKAVGKAAFEIVEEVRRQFRTMKGLMSGKQKPDYAKAVDIATASALQQLMIPGAMAVLTPLAVGFLFGAQALGGLLAGAIASGFLLAIFMTTSGGAWDNAKKLIEDGAYGGKGSDAHKAAIVGDTVGDPMKDTCGPSLNSLIKVLNTVSLVFAGAIVANSLMLI